MADPFVVEGFDSLERGLEQAPELAMREITAAMQRSVLTLQGWIAVYPPESEGNLPGRVKVVTRNGRTRAEPLGYYERGRGWWYPLKRRPEGKVGKRLGTQRLSKKQAEALGMLGVVAGYRLRRTSERLGTRWTSEVVVRADAVIGEVGTVVGYADAVQGAGQRDIFAERKWGTIDQALAACEDDIVGYFEQAAENVAKFLGGRS